MLYVIRFKKNLHRSPSNMMISTLGRKKRVLRVAFGGKLLTNWRNTTAFACPADKLYEVMELIHFKGDM